MIKNERQYHVTRSQIEKFEDALKQAANDKSAADSLQTLKEGAFRSKLADLREDVRQYETLRAGMLPEGGPRPLEELPDALVEARLASGLTHRDLAERLEIQEQQVQRYEATNYHGASLARVLDVAEALQPFTITFELQDQRTATLAELEVASPSNLQAAGIWQSGIPFWTARPSRLAAPPFVPFSAGTAVTVAAGYALAEPFGTYGPARSFIYGPTGGIFYSGPNVFETNVFGSMLLPNQQLEAFLHSKEREKPEQRPSVSRDLAQTAA
jgi:transcriptional regulator with XRE-family HTH domain